MRLIETSRLLLRPWREEDFEPFCQMNSDSKVMRFFPKTMNVDESRGLLDRLQKHIDQHGYGMWAVELKESQQFIGVLVLLNVNFDAPFTPAVEIGWRLRQQYWGQGYAPEGARAALEFGFRELNQPEIVAFTVPDNLPSQRVMEKIGMTQDLGGDFIHPRVPEGHPFALHILYRIKRLEWESQEAPVLS